MAQFYKVAQKWLEIFERIKVLFVFDGAVPPEKKEKHEDNRRKLWEKAKQIWSKPHPLQQIDFKNEILPLIIVFFSENPKLLQNIDDPTSIDLYRYLLIQMIKNYKNFRVKKAKGQ